MNLQHLGDIYICHSPPFRGSETRAAVAKRRDRVAKRRDRAAAVTSLAPASQSGDPSLISSFMFEEKSDWISVAQVEEIY